VSQVALRVARNLTLGLVLLAGLVPVVAVAVEDPDILTIRAQALARDGQCGEALEMLGRLPAPTARSLLLTGQCQIEAKQFGPAVASLELAMARFHQGDFAGSRAALDTAAARLPDSAEVRADAAGRRDLCPAGGRPVYDQLLPRYELDGRADPGT